MLPQACVASMHVRMRVCLIRYLLGAWQALGLSGHADKQVPGACRAHADDIISGAAEDQQAV